MLKVLHVFGRMEIGGAELRTLALMDSLKDEAKFVFLALSGKHGRLDQEIEALGGQVFPIALGPTFPFAYLALLRRAKPDVVDSHVATFSGALLFGAWLTGVRTRVAHFRSDGDGHAATAFRKLQRWFMVRLIERFATDIVGVSPSSLTHGFRPGWEADERAKVIVNGIPAAAPVAHPGSLRSLIGVQPASVVLLHVGRPSPEKNRAFAVEVLKALHEGGILAHLVFVGGKSDVAEGLVPAKGHDDATFVHHIGPRRDVRDLMQQASLLLSTSTREGLPGVILESLSVGTPVVATDLPGAAFIAEHVSGVHLVDLYEPAEVWASRVVKVLNATDDALQQNIRSLFSQSVFSLSRSSSEHLDLYKGRGRSQVNPVLHG